MNAERRNVLMLVGVVAVLAAITIVFGYKGYALNGNQDAIFFAPAAVGVATGHGLVNPLPGEVMRLGDPTGQARFLLFPPLFPMVVGSFLSRSVSLPYPAQALLVGSILNTIALALMAIVLYAIATMHGKTFDGFAVALISAILLTTLRLSWGFMARPEMLESVLLATGFLLALSVRRPLRVALGFSLLLGFLAATHPVGTVLFALLIALFFSYRYPWKRAIRWMSFTYGGSLLPFFLVMQVSPYGITETFRGIFFHGSAIAPKLTIMQSVGTLLQNPFAVTAAIPVALVVVLCVRLLFRSHGQIGSRALFVLSAASIAGLFAYLTVNGMKTYYVVLFSLVIFSAFVSIAVHVISSRVIRSLLLAVVMLSAAFSLKPILIFPSFLEYGTDIAEAREEFRDVTVRYPGREVFIAASLWVLTDDYAHVHYLGDIPSGTRPEHSLILLDQNYSYANASPSTAPLLEANGCALVEDRFVKETPTLFGVSLAPTMPGYGFAVYACGL